MSITQMMCPIETSLVTIFREEGPAALYKGFAPKVLRLAPGGGVLLLVVEATLGLIRTSENFVYLRVCLHDTDNTSVVNSAGSAVCIDSEVDELRLERLHLGWSLNVHSYTHGIYAFSALHPECLLRFLMTWIGVRSTADISGHSIPQDHRMVYLTKLDQKVFEATDKHYTVDEYE